MVKHPTSRRVHREKHDEDAFVATVSESTIWAQQNQRILTIVGIVLVLGVAAGLYYKNWRAKHLNDAAEQLNIARSTVMQGNHQLAMRDLKQYIAKFGDTPAGDEARLMLAQVQMEEGQPQAAIATIKPLAGDPRNSEGVSAALMLGAAYEAAKQLDKAEETYANVGAKARFAFEKREGFDRAAAVALARNNPAKVAGYYEKALATMKRDDEERPLYEMRIAEVRAGQPPAASSK